MGEGSGTGTVSSIGLTSLTSSALSNKDEGIQ